MDSLDAFMLQQRLRVKQALADTPKIPNRRVGTDDASDPDYPVLKAYIRTETVGHQTPQGRKERNIGQ